jgi:hypothetical protein
MSVRSSGGAVLASGAPGIICASRAFCSSWGSTGRSGGSCVNRDICWVGCLFNIHLLATQHADLCIEVVYHALEIIQADNRAIHLACVVIFIRA